jgi:hypothetical protein
MTTLTIIQDAQDALGLVKSDQVFGTFDNTAKLMAALLNREARRLASKFQWQALVKEETFTTTAAEDQGALETLCGDGDYLALLPETVYNTTLRVPVRGPNDPRTWQDRKAYQLSGPYPEYRIRGGSLLFYPVPAAGQTIRFEYKSADWCYNVVAGPPTVTTWKEYTTADDDQVVFDHDLMVAAVVMRYLQKNNLPANEGEYLSLLTSLQRSERSSQTLGAGGRRNYSAFPGVICPDGDWSGA